MLEQLAASGMTMVLVTHEMGFARRIADLLVFMHGGQVREMGSGGILADPRTSELRQFVSHELAAHPNQ